MTNSNQIIVWLTDAILTNPEKFKTPEEWKQWLGLDAPRGQIRLCLEHLADTGKASRQLTMDWRNVPIVRYGK